MRRRLGEMRAFPTCLVCSCTLFFAIGLIYVLSGASPLGAKICFPIFTGARVLHSIVYVRALQPWRTMSYAISALSLVAMSVLILVTLLA